MGIELERACDVDGCKGSLHCRHPSDPRCSRTAPRRCTVWSYPGHPSWEPLLKNTPGGRQCARDAGHPGSHELSGPWTAIGSTQCQYGGDDCTRTDFHIHTPNLNEKLDKLANSHKEHVNHPSHYGGDTTYETVKVLGAWGLGFLLGNTVKYISRAGKKDPGKLVEDLKKAKWYLDKAIERLEAGLPLF